MIEIIIYLFLGIGVFFNILAGIGLLRFPDVYTRLHAGTKCTTFGSIFLVGSVVLLGFQMWWYGETDGSSLAIHAIVALIAILLTNPTGAHAIARAAHRSGVVPFGAVIDELKVKPEKKTMKKNPGAKKKPVVSKKEVAK
jgi:multicomponent Na+:H+ antiporter subunit G